jgi:hypothetical protein
MFCQERVFRIEKEAGSVLLKAYAALLSALLVMPGVANVIRGHSVQSIPGRTNQAQERETNHQFVVLNPNDPKKFTEFKIRVGDRIFAGKIECIKQYEAEKVFVLSSNTLLLLQRSSDYSVKITVASLGFDKNGVFNIHEQSVNLPANAEYEYSWDEKSRKGAFVAAGYAWSGGSSGYSEVVLVKGDKVRRFAVPGSWSAMFVKGTNNIVLNPATTWAIRKVLGPFGEEALGLGSPNGIIILDSETGDANRVDLPFSLEMVSSNDDGSLTVWGRQLPTNNESDRDDDDRYVKAKVSSLSNPTVGLEVSLLTREEFLRELYNLQKQNESPPFTPFTIGLGGNISMRVEARRDDSGGSVLQGKLTHKNTGPGSKEDSAVFSLRTSGEFLPIGAVGQNDIVVTLVQGHNSPDLSHGELEEPSSFTNNSTTAGLYKIKIEEFTKFDSLNEQGHELIKKAREEGVPSEEIFGQIEKKIRGDFWVLNKGEGQVTEGSDSRWWEIEDKKNGERALVFLTLYPEGGYSFRVVKLPRWDYQTK